MYAFFCFQVRWNSSWQSNSFNENHSSIIKSYYFWKLFAKEADEHKLQREEKLSEVSWGSSAVFHWLYLLILSRAESWASRPGLMEEELNFLEGWKFLNVEEIKTLHYLGKVCEKTLLRIENPGGNGELTARASSCLYAVVSLAG